MRVLVNLEDRNIVVQAGGPELRRFIDEKLRLVNRGEIYEYDDGVEYGGQFWIEMRRYGDIYTIKVEKQDAAGDWYLRGVIRFSNLPELLTTVNMVERYCNSVKGMNEREREILKHHMTEYREQVICEILLYADIYELAKRMLLIARRLRLF